MKKTKFRFIAALVCILFAAIIFAHDTMAYALPKDMKKHSKNSGKITKISNKTVKKSKINAVPVVEEEPVVEEVPVVEELELNAYYVAKNGSDSNPGTREKPWGTIRKAVETVKPGDTVYIKGGVYNERVVLKKSGAEGKYITFTNYPGEEVVIDGKGIDWGYNWDCLFDLNNQNYIKVKGLKVINSRWVGIGSLSDHNGGENVIVQDCSIHHTKSSGIGFSSAKGVIIEGNTVEDANTANSQEAISLENVNNFIVKNNLVFNCPREGIDAKNGCINGKIYGNTVYDVKKIGIYVDAYSKHQYNIEVYDNTVYDCDQGITVATENSGFLENINIHDNTVKNCTWGLAIGGWDEGYTHAMRGITFNKNTVINSRLVSMYLGNNEVENIRITNNYLNGSSASIPIYRVEGVQVDKMIIDGNTLNIVAKHHPTGTNYTLA